MSFVHASVRLLAGALLALGGLATASHAEVLLQGSARTQCLDMSSGTARLTPCIGSAGQNIFSASGPQRYGNMCVQGTGGNNATNVLTLKACNASKDQTWAIDNRTGNFKNAGGWCAAATSSGTVIAAQCYGGGTYAWSIGIVMPAASAGSVALKVSTLKGGATADASGKLVALGGGSTVAQDKGAIVAQGAGNIVAQVGGNIIKTTGGSIVSQGGGN